MNGHFLAKMADMFHWICSAIIKGECGLMKSPRETRPFYASRERWLSNLTQHLIQFIVPKAFMGWALILTPVAILLIIRESLTRRSSESSPICSIICLLGGQLGVEWWAPSSCATQLFLQLINFTLLVPFTLCIGDMALPSLLTLAGMCDMHGWFGRNIESIRYKNCSRCSLSNSVVII